MPKKLGDKLAKERIGIINLQNDNKADSISGFVQIKWSI